VFQQNGESRNLKKRGGLPPFFVNFAVFAGRKPTILPPGMKFSLLTKKKRGGKAGFGAIFVHIAFKSAMFHYKFYFFYKRKLLLFFESYGKINESDMR